MPKNYKEENLNFVYDSAVGRMGKIDDDIKAISARTTWLLGIVIVANLAFFGFILQTSFAEEVGAIQQYIKDSFIILCVIYLAVIFVYTLRQLEADFGLHAYNDPIDLKRKGALKNDIGEVKANMLEDMQDKIDYNTGLFEKLIQRYRRLGTLFIFSPIWAFAINLYTLFA